jgi:hypothetical protein
MEERYVSQVSSFEDELQGIVMSGHAACKAAYAQPEGPSSLLEVASQLRWIPRHLKEIAQFGLSTRAHMALVIVGTIYTHLNISTIRGKTTDTDLLLYSQHQQQAIELSEAIIHEVDPSVIVQGSVPYLLKDLDEA